MQICLDQQAGQIFMINIHFDYTLVYYPIVFKTFKSLIVKRYHIS